MSPKQRPTRCLLTEYTQVEWRYLWLLVIKYGTCCPWSQHIMTSSQNLQSHKLSYTVYKIQSLGSHSIFLLYKVQVHCRKLPHLPTSPPPPAYFSGFTLSSLITFYTPADEGRHFGSSILPMNCNTLKAEQILSSTWFFYKIQGQLNSS